MKNFFRILAYVKPYKGYATLNVLFNVLSVLFSLVSLTMVIPFLGLLFGTQPLVKEVPTAKMSPSVLIDYFYYYLSKIIIEQGKLDALIFICILVAALFFLKNLFRYLAMYYMAPIRSGVVRDLRNALYRKVNSLPISYFSEERKGDVMARMSSDVQEIEWAVLTSLEVIFREPLTILSFLITMVVWSPKLTLFVFLLLPVTGLIIGRVGKSLKRSSVKGQHKMGELLTVIEETLAGLRIIKAFTAERIMIRRFKIINQEYFDVNTKMYRKRDLSSPMSEFLGVIVMVIVMYLGGRLVLAHDEGLNPAVFIAYIAVFSQIISPAKSFSTAYYNVQKGNASAERINVILDAELKIVEKDDALPIKEFVDKVEYRNVSFAYRSEPVLKNINLTINKGKTIALVGQSGSGKSTLADLLPRFYDVIGGDLLIDGVSIKDLRLADLRRLMGVVTQESILFNDTIENNIAFGSQSFTHEDVVNAAKIANAHEFIIQFPEGYQTNIGDRGGKLSGGQRQRLSIARAVLKNPPILILDEATSALDTESERLVQEALSNLMKSRTSIVIAHRLSTIQHADEIIVLQQGEIIERGKHQELIEQNGVYKRLCEMQAFYKG